MICLRWTKFTNKFLLTGEIFMPELHLEQPKFTYSGCGPFTKHCERIQKFRETGNLKKLYRNELGKACFTLNAEYSDSKDLGKRTISDKFLKERAIYNEIARNCKDDWYPRALATMVYKVFDKRTGSGVNVNEQLAEELHQPVIKKFKRRKIYTRFKDNIWAANVAEMGSFSCNINLKYLLCHICFH